MNRTRLNDDVTVSDQPTDAELEQLAADGFRTVINFRTAGEEDQPLSPDDEGRVVKDAGLEYLHYPVNGDLLSVDYVDRFREMYQRLPKPVLAHCRLGARAAVMMLMHYGAEEGLAGEELLEKGKREGYPCDIDSLQQFAKAYGDAKNQ